MKTMKNLVLVLLMSAAVYSNATVSENLPVDKITTLRFSSVQKGEKILLKNAVDEILFSETVSYNGSYQKKFDLTALEEGFYSIELHKQTAIIKKSFQIKNGTLSEIIMEETPIYEPLARLKDDKLLVSQLSFIDSPLLVDLYYKDTLVHSDKISGRQFLTRIYQLSKFRRGRYTVVMHSNTRKYVKNLYL